MSSSFNLSLGKFTIFSLAIIESIVAYNLLKSNQILDISDLRTFDIIYIVGFLLLLDFFIKTILDEFYEKITRFLFRRQMLEYTYKKKNYQNKNKEVNGITLKSNDNLPPSIKETLKNHDKLPSSIKETIDKLDELFYKDKLPHFYDLTLGFMNIFFFMVLSLLQNNLCYVMFSSIASIFFILLIIKSFIEIGNMISIEYASVFEE
ncbi:hypothetical protein MettiDRAFT_2642 [Methanolobus tindarius DSM 2278]|uniref:Uncharacterized protein n=1 Tax=Methanolobus tindarius DSM 2278 TaxID=1090322 RepID=W9DTN3_METTI|nr:hypothetical protein [Methanolobus tindarius]ETA69148.1 hypothetical protein MettiDRAFT_2642 [Methanolobus tindarius DSM 2278]